MKTPKKKLCWNCEGRVTLTEEYCPFCGVYLSPSTLPEGADHQQHLAPPYKLVEDPSENNLDDANDTDKDDQKLEISEEQEESFKNTLLTIFCLLGGVIFFLFGLVLLLFSQQGVFTLQWKASYWIFYLLVSLPLLLIGWNKLKTLPD